MDEILSQNDENIRKIEDIIDIQKANGNYMRQVCFNLPSETESTVSANLARSLESGLSTTKSVSEKGKVKKKKSKRRKSPLPDVFSWPSDSDITVLRMKLCLTNPDLKENVDNVILGDGLHQPDSSSMVNLATLINHPSKQSLNIEEYLLPLTSWERSTDQDTCDLQPTIKEETFPHKKVGFSPDIAEFGKNEYHDEKITFNNGEYQSPTRKAKIARFLRLYFCPCCTCLYKIEKMNNEHTSLKNESNSD